MCRTEGGPAYKSASALLWRALDEGLQLLYLPDTFPASYLQIYDSILPTCLKVARPRELLDLPSVLGCNAPQLSLENLQESIIGYGFLTAAPYIADLFFAVSDIPGVQTAKFPAMACYGDSDYWLGGLLLAFDTHQHAPPSRAGGALLAGRAYHRPTQPETAFKLGGQGRPVIQGQVPPSCLQKWARAARSSTKPPGLHRTRKSMHLSESNSMRGRGGRSWGTHTISPFDPAEAPLNFLGAVRRALAACVANQDIEHFWATFNLEWPDAKTRSNVSFRQVPPLACLVAKAAAEPSAEEEEAQPMEVRSSATEEESDEADVQVNDWRFSELETTDLATLREVDLCVPFRFPSNKSPRWRSFVSCPTRRVPLRGKPEWCDAITAHWASHKGLAASNNTNKGAFNAAWSKLYYNHKVGDPAMLAAVKRFPLTINGNTVTAQEVKGAIKTVWHAASTKLAELGTTVVPPGTPPLGGGTGGVF